MRISDWSSDVCSSDLPSPGQLQNGALVRRTARGLCMTAQREARHAGHSDIELAAAIAHRDPAALRLVMRRHDQRLLRTAWRILRNSDDAEDAVRSERRRGGKEWVRPCRSRGWAVQ